MWSPWPGCSSGPQSSLKTLAACPCVMASLDPVAVILFRFTLRGRVVVLESFVAGHLILKLHISNWLDSTPR